MTTQATHTPTPWYVDERGNIRQQSTGNVLADMQDGTRVNRESRISKREMEANAAFIVRACNSHEKLVEALKGMLVPHEKGWNVTDWEIRCEAARAALREAGEA